MVVAVVAVVVALLLVAVLLVALLVVAVVVASLLVVCRQLLQEQAHCLDGPEHGYFEVSTCSPRY